MSSPRLIRPDELHATIDLAAVAFGMGPRSSEDDRAQGERSLEPDRTFVIDDGDVVAGTASAFSFQIGLPGGTLPIAGVTWVGVLPTHRRRGALSSLMRAVLDQAVERGEALAGLTASEGGIYRRFGYGVAARLQTLHVDATRARVVSDLDPSAHAGGTVRLLAAAEAERVLPRVWDRHWRRTPGEVSRSPGFWAALAVDPAGDRGGASARYVVVHETEGVPDGFATYRIKQNWRDDGTHHELRVETVAAADDAVVARLVRYLLDVDLVGTVQWEVAPLDLPLRWQLADPRALATRAERDMLWLRPLDVARCLGARTYAASGGLVVEVVDTGRPQVGGRFALDAAPDGAACHRTDAPPDVVVRVAELGALLLSGVSWATLHRAGLVAERVPGAVDRADALFRPGRAPFCATDF